MSILYIVATPIGNLEDITLRAIRVLKEVDLVLCEDTRVTKRLLDKYEINTPTMSYHAQSKLSKVEKIFALLEDGKNLALVSDAGTPTISDPGCLLVAQVRERFGLPADLPLRSHAQAGGSAQAGDAIAIVPIPGPSAVLSALSVSGFPTSEFLFLGFLPHKKGRETLFKEIAASKRTVVFYESPHRILKTLESLKQYLHPKPARAGTHAGGRRILIARELTKIYEENFVGEPEEALTHFLAHPDRVRGEFVVVVEGV